MSRDSVVLATEPRPDRPAADRLFPTLFVCLFVYSKTPKIAAGGDCGDGGGGPRPVGVGVGGRARGGYLHRAPTVNWD